MALIKVVFGVVLSHLPYEICMAILSKFLSMSSSSFGKDSMLANFCRFLAEIQSAVVSFTLVMQDKNARVFCPQEGGQNNTQDVSVPQGGL